MLIMILTLPEGKFNHYNQGIVNPTDRIVKFGLKLRKKFRKWELLGIKKRV